MLPAVRRCRPTEEYVIPPYSWQSYGDYTAEPGKWFAAPVRASNEFMAREAVLRSVHPLNPVITRIYPVEPMVRNEKDRRRWRREKKRGW